MSNTNNFPIISSLIRFYREFRKFYHYILYYIKMLEKTRVSNTSLGYIWWFLDPLLNMGIYIILVRLVFQQRDPNFPVFFFSAMLAWRYFSMSITQASLSITEKISICKDTYVPKFIFPLAVCIAGLSPFIVSLMILIVLMIIFQTPITLYLLYMPLLTLSLIFLTFGISMFLAHIQAFMYDFRNILPHLITLGLFATPIFYDINKIPDHYRWIVTFNPVAPIVIGFRNIITYGTQPPLKALICSTIFSIFICVLGIHIIYRNDQTYNRISR